ncbi:MAG: zinc ribbon domain-containing protein [Clostridia bacterium]|nr:zinc ribbon domain-containing protein [Clostridia bacterium]
MEFVDKAISKAKEVIDVASQKTGEVVATEKQRFDIATLKSKREKDFLSLGKLCFEMVKDSEELDPPVKALIESIKEKSAEIDALNEEILKIKNKTVCLNCGASVEKGSAYCNKCGFKM